MRIKRGWPVQHSAHARALGPLYNATRPLASPMSAAEIARAAYDRGHALDGGNVPTCLPCPAAGALLAASERQAADPDDA
jgi:hypothetical protein